MLISDVVYFAIDAVCICVAVRALLVTVCVACNTTKQSLTVTQSTHECEIKQRPSLGLSDQRVLISQETRALIILSGDSCGTEAADSRRTGGRKRKRNGSRQSVMHMLTCFLLVVVVAVTVINFVAKIVRLWFLSGVKRRGSGDA